MKKKKARKTKVKKPVEAAEGMTFDEFADAVLGCDCTKANMMGNIDIGGPFFTSD